MYTEFRSRRPKSEYRKRRNIYLHANYLHFVCGIDSTEEFSCTPCIRPPPPSPRHHNIQINIAQIVTRVVAYKTIPPEGRTYFNSPTRFNFAKIPYSFPSCVPSYLRAEFPVSFEKGKKTAPVWFKRSNVGLICNIIGKMSRDLVAVVIWSSFPSRLCICIRVFQFSPSIINHFQPNDSQVRNENRGYWILSKIRIYVLDSASAYVLRYIYYMHLYFIPVECTRWFSRFLNRLCNCY